MTLAWALTHWKAQGMTLSRVRVALGRAAAMAGVGYVAVTRVKHYRHIVFEGSGLPAYETFQQAKDTEAFRSRRRFDLRCLVKFSRTLRRWRFCEGDLWTQEEATAAEALLVSLRVRGQLQRASQSASGRPTDEDAYIWDADPDFDGLLGEVAREVAQGDDAVLEFHEAVAQRLRGELHMPAVRSALGCLIPEGLHPRLDGKKPRRERGGDLRVGVHLEADRWKLDVSEETALASPERSMSKGALEFFLKIGRCIASRLGLPIVVGTSELGRRVGMMDESVENLCSTVEGWQSWNQQERERVRSSREFVLPVLWSTTDSSSPGRDWLFASVTPEGDAGSLMAAPRLRVRVFDRVGRPTAPEQIGRKLVALVRGVVSRRTDMLHAELGAFPVCAGSQDSIVAVTGLVFERLAAAVMVVGYAGASPPPSSLLLTSGSADFVREVRRSLSRTFAKLRQEADACGKRDVCSGYMVTEVACREIMGLLAFRIPLGSAANAVNGLGADLVSSAGGSSAPQVFVPLRVLTWNVSECDGCQRISAQAPDDLSSWSGVDNLAAVQLEILRYRADVVSLQECPSEDALPRLLSDYILVGARVSHAGFVHLYVLRTWGDVARVHLPELPVVAGRLQLGRTTLDVLAMHLEPHAEGASVRCGQWRTAVRMVREAATGAASGQPGGLVILGDLNVRQTEVDEQCKALGVTDSEYDGFSWDPNKNRYYAREGDSKLRPQRFDRVLCSGAVASCAFLVGQCRQYWDGHHFYLSDHFGVLALLDVHGSYVGRAGVKVPRERRRALGHLRDEEALSESRIVSERRRIGEEQAAVMRARAADRDRGIVNDRARSSKEKVRQEQQARYEEVFGARSLFALPITESLSDSALAPVSPSQLSITAWAGLPSGKACSVWSAYDHPPLKGLRNPNNFCYALVVVQVFLRTPSIAIWLHAHTARCAVQGLSWPETAAACPCCALQRSRDQLGSLELADLLRHRFLVGRDFSDALPHDAADFAHCLLQSMRSTEIGEGRFANWYNVRDDPVRCTHVDRLFGFVVESRVLCEKCKACCCTFSDGNVLGLILPVSRKGVLTVADLYSQFVQRERSSCAPCPKCGSDGDQWQQRRVCTHSNVLMLRIKRSIDGGATVLRNLVAPDEQLSLPGVGGFEL